MVHRGYGTQILVDLHFLNIGLDNGRGAPDGRNFLMLARDDAIHRLVRCGDRRVLCRCSRGLRLSLVRRLRLCLCRTRQGTHDN